MAKLKYVMNELEQKLYDTIEQEGRKVALQALIRALIEHSHEASDMGLKEKSRSSYELADILQDVRDTIEE